MNAEQPVSPPEEDLCPYCMDPIEYRRVHRECREQFNYDNREK